MNPESADGRNWDWEKVQKNYNLKGDDLNDSKNNLIKKILLYLITGVIIIAILLTIMSGMLYKWTSYEFNYQNKIQQQIIEMVKPESLKDKYKKGI